MLIVIFFYCMSTPLIQKDRIEVA